MKPRVSRCFGAGPFRRWVASNWREQSYFPTWRMAFDYALESMQYRDYFFQDWL
jgi:hypothetical protein